MTIVFRRRRHKSIRFLCPGCRSPFLWAQVGLVRGRNALPDITAIHGLLICAHCQRHIDYNEFLDAQGVFNSGGKK